MVLHSSGIASRPPEPENGIVDEKTIQGYRPTLSETEQTEVFSVD